MYHREKDTAGDLCWEQSGLTFKETIKATAEDEFFDDRCEYDGCDDEQDDGDGITAALEEGDEVLLLKIFNETKPFKSG